MPTAEEGWRIVGSLVRADDAPRWTSTISENFGPHDGYAEVL